MSSKTLFGSRSLWFSAFILLLLLLPLPFGTNRPWAANLFGLLSGFLLVGMLLQDENKSLWAGNPPHKRLALAAIGLTGVIVWSFFQVVPWTPESWHHPIWQGASKLLGSAEGSISVDPGAFAESLVRLLGYISCFLLAFFGGRDRDNAKAMIRALAFGGVAYALYGLLAQATGSETILWYKKWAYQGFLTSTFVNKNSYAAYAGFGLLSTLVVARNHLKHVEIKDRVLAQKSRFAALFMSLGLRDYAFLAMPVILLAALALTGSRAGTACVFLGVIVFFAALAINRRWSAKKGALWAGLLFGLFVLFVAIGGDALLVRLDDQRVGEDSATRLAAYALVKQAIADNPWLGFGLGSFEKAFQLYRDDTLSAWFHHAHNDYLEMAMDLGLPAFILLLFSLGLLISCCVQGVWERRRDAIYPALALAATFLIGAHVSVDFSLHIPAIAATYAALLGLGVTQSFSSRDKGAEKKPSPKPVLKAAPRPQSLPQTKKAEAPEAKKEPPQQQDTPAQTTPPAQPLPPIPKKPSPNNRKNRPKAR